MPLCAPTMAYHGSENEVTNWNRPSPEELPLRVREPVADVAEHQREREVGRVRERNRHLPDEDVAGDPAAEPHQQRHA